MYLTQVTDVNHAATLTEAMAQKANLSVAGVYNPLSAKLAKDAVLFHLSGAFISLASATDWRDDFR